MDEQLSVSDPRGDGRVIELPRSGVDAETRATPPTWTSGQFAPHLRRLGIVMEPSPGDPHEVEGVLNPAAARGPDGQLYLLPRLVGSGNYSRIGLVRVRFTRRGEPSGVRRLGSSFPSSCQCQMAGRLLR